MARSIAARQRTETERAERRAELDGRDREHGGLVPGDRDREAAQRSMSGWTPYRSATTAREVLRALDNPPDPRIITVGRLVSDCRSAVRRWAGKFPKDDREAIATEAALCLLRWPTHGGNVRSDGTRSVFIDLGGQREASTLRRSCQRSAPNRARAVLSFIDAAPSLATVGTLPRRRDWIDSATNLPTAPAWHALHAAVKQAAEDRRTIGTDAREEPTEGVTLAELAERRRAEDTAPSGLPDSAAPEILAEYLGVPLDAARAIVFQSFPAATATDMAAVWGMSRASVKVAVSRGSKIVRERWPDFSDLLSALDDAGAAYRTATERSAILALVDYRDGWTERDRAADAVAEWRGASAGLDDQSRAVLSAARSAIVRHGGSYGAERAERIAASVPRLVDAEQRAAKRRCRVARTGRVHACAQSAQRVQRAPLSPEQRSKLAAQQDELARLLASAAPDGVRVRELRASIARGAQVARA